MLSKAEKERYNRHLILNGFGEEAQLKLRQAKVFVIGAGGLGCPVLTYLTAAGVGKIGIVDHDIVSVSNLQRQTLYSQEDIGKSKAFVAKDKLLKQNPHVDITVFDVAFTSKNAERIVSEFDIVIDGTDNFPTRYLINDVCVLQDKVNVHGSINEFSGQVAIFNAKLGNVRSANYRDLYPVPPNPDEVKNCSETGVIGVLPGIVGNFQALETIKIITDIGEPLINKVLFYNALSQEMQTFNFEKDDENPITGLNPTQSKLIDYDEFCGIKKINKEMKSINVQDLKEMMDNKENFTLIDVREPFEYEAANLGGELIPMNTVPDNHEKFKKEGKVIVQCRSGARSANVVSFLEQNYGYENLYNLDGGILAWARIIDMNMKIG